MSTYRDVFIVVGATNEDAALKKTVRTVMESCRPEDIGEVRVMRSKTASPGCIAACEEMARAYPGKVTCVVQTRPYIGGAIRDGFDAARSSHILLLPGDLALELSVVPKLIEEAKKHPDALIKSSRWMEKGAFHGYSPVRKCLNLAAQILIRVLFGTRVRDLTNPVQIMPAALYHAIDWQELNFPFLVEMVLVPLRLGTEIREVPAACFGRREGRSNNSFLQTALYLKTVLRIRFSTPENLLK
ncbi:MAG: glycosyltransferase [Clostridia bacterium]|nr:glycosyltransferase [Clostridia bacterium]